MKNTLCLYTELCIERRRYDFKNYIIITLTLTSLFMHWRGERNIWSVFYAAILRYGLSVYIFARRLAMLHAWTGFDIKLLVYI
jgi:hypothetical protein